MLNSGAQQCPVQNEVILFSLSPAKERNHLNTILPASAHFVLPVASSAKPMLASGPCSSRLTGHPTSNRVSFSCQSLSHIFFTPLCCHNNHGCRPTHLTYIALFFPENIRSGTSCSPHHSLWPKVDWRLKAAPAATSLPFLTIVTTLFYLQLKKPSQQDLHNIWLVLT